MAARSTRSIAIAAVALATHGFFTRAEKQPDPPPFVHTVHPEVKAPRHGTSATGAGSSDNKESNKDGDSNSNSDSSGAPSSDGDLTDSDPAAANPDVKRPLPGSKTPVRVVATLRLSVTTPHGTGELPYLASRPLTEAAPDVTRVVIVLHGSKRDARAYAKATARAAKLSGAAAAHSMWIVPHFLNTVDTDAHGVAPEVLRWKGSGWLQGKEAVGPAPLSSFEVLDVILTLLADESRYPALRQVVIAGHSAGGQVVQRYAVVGAAQDVLARRGVAVRHVVINPSSYLYFDTWRPQAGGGWAEADADACPKFNDWKYGWGRAPAYATQQCPVPAVCEARFRERDVRVLLGTADDDATHPSLDNKCGAAAQGPHRLARGIAYVEALRRRPAGGGHGLYLVPGIAHSCPGMLKSACGRLALFDDPQADCSPERDLDHDF